MKGGLNELALFAGVGGGILGGGLLGWRTVCAVEIEPYAASILTARQNEGILPPFPIWDDICTFDGKPWRGIVDIISGGFPCQDISTAGKRKGITGERSGLWREMARIIGEVRPRFAFIENSPMLIIRGLDRVLCDLAEMGYDARWGIVSAADTGAPHLRERVWILAYPLRDRLHGGKNKRDRKNENRISENESDNGNEIRSEINGCGSVREQENMAHPDLLGRVHGQSEIKPAKRGVDALGQFEPGSTEMADSESLESGQQTEREGRKDFSGGGGNIGGDKGTGNTGKSNDFSDSDLLPVQGMEQESQQSGQGRPTGLYDREAGESKGNWWAVEPDVGRVAHGVAARVDRLKAIGNGQVPKVAKLAWEILSEE